ncbi:tetratricopeptide repeat protein [Prosthecobacter sp.]|uniref:tetratricopeptide repeat protein n=1 Tax=Prosthecobacter sp. TaxID=1965333 RepID=UPI00378370F2
MSRNLQSVVKEEAPDTHRQVQELAAFRRMLQFSEGTFSLSFAVCDSRSLRDSLVKRFCDETPGILVVTLPAGVESVLRHVESQITDVPPRAVFILDIEASIPSGSENQPTLRVLNASRERWEKLRCPVVFWLAEYAITLLYDHAPDFWRYRSHQFEFVPEPVPIEQLRSEAFSGYDMVDALPYDEKAFRVIELERRISEAGDPPSAELLPHVLMWVYELARLYEHASRYREAELRLRRALEWSKDAFGDSPSKTIDALGNLASLLHTTNRLVEAELLMREALEIGEACFGSEHRQVAIHLSNLASLLQDTNRLTEAEPLIRRALQIDESSFGSEHAKVGADLNNLADLLKDMNRLTEAEPLMRRALHISEACFGPKHPTVAILLNNLASLLHHTNRMAEAEPLLRRALQIDEASFGSENPKVARDLNNLALVLQDTSKLAEAEPLMHRALRISINILGADHPNSQKALHNYTSLLQAMKLSESEIQQRIKEATEGGTPVHP